MEKEKPLTGLTGQQRTYCKIKQDLSYEEVYNLIDSVKVFTDLVATKVLLLVWSVPLSQLIKRVWEFFVVVLERKTWLRFILVLVALFMWTHSEKLNTVQYNQSSTFYYFNC